MAKIYTYRIRDNGRAGEFRVIDIGVALSVYALENIEETGVVPEDDIAALKCGAHTCATLLAHCLDGAAEDRYEGWRDYVSSLCEAAWKSESPRLNPQEVK